VKKIRNFKRYEFSGRTGYPGRDDHLVAAKTLAKGVVERGDLGAALCLNIL